MKQKLYKLHNQSLQKHKVANLKELWEKLEAKGYKGFEVQVDTVFTKSEKDNVFHAVFSTDSVDRHGDIVVQNWKLTNFKKNPVYLDSHNYNSIEHIIGKVNKIKVKDNKLEGDIEFAMSNPKGVMASEMARDGFLNASSVGFIPLKFDDKFEKILESELLEISAVSVPANPEATYEKQNDNTRKDSGKDNAEDTANNDSKEERKESEEEIIKSKTPSQLLKQAIAKEIDIKEKALSKILSAIELVANETKGRADLGNSQTANNKINRAVKILLKMKN